MENRCNLKIIRVFSLNFNCMYGKWLTSHSELVHTHHRYGINLSVILFELTVRTNDNSFKQTTIPVSAFKTVRGR